jgi:hypothetical protein
MRNYVHVNKHIIGSNKKRKEDKPPLTAKNYKSNKYGRQIDILDKDGNIAASLIYTPNKPLSCGAVAYIVTDNEVVVKENVEEIRCNKRSSTQRKNRNSNPSSCKNSKLCKNL